MTRDPSHVQAQSGVDPRPSRTDKLHRFGECFAAKADDTYWMCTFRNAKINFRALIFKLEISEINVRKG